MPSRSLKPTRDPRGLIDRDQACAHCGYNLRGLQRGGVCPECGAAIPIWSGVKEVDDLTHAPLAYLRQLRLACFMLAISASVGMLMMLLSWFSVIMLGIAGIAAGAWWVAVWIVTRPRAATDGTRVSVSEELRIARLVSRLTQAAWAPACFIAIAMIELASVPGTAGAIFVFVGLAWLVFVMVGLVGLVPLCIVLSNIAHWGMETTLGHQFRMTAMSLAVCGWMVAASFFVLLLTQATLTFTFFTGLAGFVFFVFINLVLVGLVYFSILLFRLANLARWAIINAEEAIGRNERLAARVARARARQRFQDPHPSAQPYVDNDDPIPLAEPEGPRP